MGFLDKIATWLEKHLLPIAGKIGRQRHLAAMRDGFIALLPIAMMGSIVVMFNSVLFTEGSLIGEQLNKISWYASSIQPLLNTFVTPVLGQIWWGTLALGVIFSVFTISYHLGESYEVDGLSTGLVATVSYLTLLPQSASEAAGWGTLSWTSFNSSAIFTGLLTAIIVTEIFSRVTKKGWVIKMPEQVPPAVSKAFSAVIPGGIAILVFGIISIVFINFVGTPVKDFIDMQIQSPLVHLGQSPLTLIFLMVLSQLFWFFGLHGANIVGPFLDTMYGPALSANFEAVTALNIAAPHVLTRNFTDVYGMHGGSGATLGLIIAIFIFSKRQEFKELAKLATPSGIFQINEPVIFGLPIVLNPMMFIPFVITPAISIFIAWLFTGPIPFAGRLYMSIPWTTPPIISAFLASGGNIPATILATATLILSVFIYAPFVIVANKQNSTYSENVE